jgi:uncharacterized membrane protein YcaP (DUF421 family)
MPKDVSVFFSGWEPIVRIVVLAPLAYLALLVLFRATGNRTLARMNSFDFIITIAIGATFGRVMTARSIPLAEAVTAFATLVLLQYAVTWLRVRSARVADLVTTAPTLLYFQGRVLGDALRAQRITEDELRAAAREHGLGSLGEAEAVVLEPNGKLAVVKPASAGDNSALPPRGDG